MDKKDRPAVRLAPPEPEKPEDPMCVVCGSYEGDMPGAAGAARWHAACEAAQPAVVAKVKARAAV